MRFPCSPSPAVCTWSPNVILEGYDESAAECSVNSRFLMLQYRREKQDVFAGTYHHRLRIEEEGFRIAAKRVDLLNCDAPLENILIYF